MTKIPIPIPREYSVKVTNKRKLASNTVHLQITSKIPIPFHPGQYTSFIMKTTRRLFSFASLPQEEIIDFVIGYKPDGPTISFIEPLQVGDSFQLLAPYGRFVVDEEDQRPLIFIAGGTGIAPILSQIKHLLSKNHAQPITLYFASYDQQRLYLQEQLQEFETQHPSFSFRPCLSEEDPSWSGRQGLVTTIIPSEIQNLSDHSFYICGSPSLVTATIDMLVTNGVQTEHIHFERFT